MTGSLWAQVGPATSTDEARPIDAFAADSLTNSAIGLAMTSGAPARGARMVILAEFARQLHTDHPAASRILADVYIVQGDSIGAAEMLRACLDAHPEDHSLWIQWLASSLLALQTAEEQFDFLDGIIRDESMPRSIRAEAIVRYGDVLLGRGDRAKAEQFFTSAMRYDPYHYGALQGWVDVQETLSTVDSANVMFRMLRGSPLDAEVAHDVGVLMGSMGLWKDAIKFLDYAWAIAVRDGGIEGVPHAWAVDYTNALIDAGQVQRAVDAATPVLEQYPTSVDLLALLAEANVGLGQSQQAQELIDRIKRAYRSGGEQGELRSYDIEMAMFYLTTKPDARLAMAHARGALQEANPDQRESVILQRLLGAAELAAGSSESGVRRLTNVQDVDIYASVFLASHYFANGQSELGRQAVLSGARLTRSGPAFRRLEAMARQNDVTIPPMAGAGQISEMAQAFNDMYLQMGLHPERFVEVSIVQPSSAFVVGQPVTLTLLLHNAGPLPVPVGPGGLFAPAAAVQVELAGPWPEPIVVTDLPLAVWPAPQRIAPGRTIGCKVRLDVGPLGDILAAHPLSQIDMTVSAVFDPIQRGSDLYSSLPDVRITPVTVTRASMMRAADGEQLDRAYRDMMAGIAANVAAEETHLRLQTARQVGCLRVLLARADAGEAELPAALPAETMRGRLAELQEQLLDDECYAVRAEMIHSLRLASVADRAMVLPTGAADPSPVVRLRTVELLGTMDNNTSRQRLRNLTEDPHSLVAETAGLLLPYVAPAPPAPAEPAAPPTPATPAEPAEPTGPAAPAEPTGPAAPAEPTTPAEPATPAAPAEPGAPAEPAAPAEPGAPVEPAAPVEPVEPGAPAEPTAPAAPGAPAEPTDPTQPAAPPEPAEPTESPAPGPAAPGDTPSDESPPADGEG